MAVFSDAFLRLRQDLDQCHDSRQKLTQDIRDSVREMAQETAELLAEQRSRRHADFTAMITDIRGQIKQQAAETRGQLAELAADLHQGGAIFGQPSLALKHKTSRR